MEIVTFDRLRRLNVERCESRQGFNHPLGTWSVLEWAGAAAGEAGETANVAKKILRLQTGILNKPDDPASMGEFMDLLAKEIGDTVIYLDLLAASQGLILQECVRQAFNTTSEERHIPDWKL